MLKRYLIVVFAGIMMTGFPLNAQEGTNEPAEDVITFRTAPPDINQFRLVEVISGLRYPLYVTGAGDGSGRIFVLEQSGRVRVLRNGILQSAPFIDLSALASQDVLSGYSERGLLGIAFHPDFAENGLFYVNYTSRSGDTQVVEYRVSPDNPDVADATSARTLLTIAQPYRNHNGGHMAFGPDGYLYISVGDGGSRDDPVRAGQNPSTLLGTILRIDVDNPTSNRPYGIPDDNPFYTNPNFAPEVWAYGLRNAWRFSFDRATGDLYIADVGQDVWEEVNFQPADSPGGENYGWPAYEARVRYIGPDAINPTFPIVEYSHSFGCSITGGYVYRGAAIPDLQGAYLYSDYCSGRLWAAYRDENGIWQSVELLGTRRQISSFGEDDDGELYLIDYQGAVFRFEPAAR